MTQENEELMDKFRDSVGEDNSMSDSTKVEFIQAIRCALELRSAAEAFEKELARIKEEYPVEALLAAGPTFILSYDINLLAPLKLDKDAPVMQQLLWGPPHIQAKMLLRLSDTVKQSMNEHQEG